MTTLELLEDNNRMLRLLTSRHGQIGPNPGQGEDGDANEHISEEFIDGLERIFGAWRDADGRRKYRPGQDAAWLQHKANFEGVIHGYGGNRFDSAIRALQEVLGDSNNDATPEIISYNGEEMVVFPGLQGLGFGTPQVFMIQADRVANYGAGYTVRKIREART